MTQSSPVGIRKSKRRPPKASAIASAALIDQPSADPVPAPVLAMRKQNHAAPVLAAPVVGARAPNPAPAHAKNAPVRAKAVPVPAQTVCDDDRASESSEGVMLIKVDSSSSDKTEEPPISEKSEEDLDEAIADFVCELGDISAEGLALAPAPAELDSPHSRNNLWHVVATPEMMRAFSAQVARSPRASG